MASHTVIVHDLNDFLRVPPYRNRVSFLHVLSLHTLLQPPKTATVKEIQRRQDGQGHTWPERVSPADKLLAKVDRPVPRDPNWELLSFASSLIWAACVP